MTKSSIAAEKSAPKPTGVTYPASSLFSPAKNSLAWLKAGLFGDTGSGKTLTAWLIAAGLAEASAGSREKPPVLFIDTENGSDYLAPLADEANIAFMSVKTRAFVDLLAAQDEAKRLGAILIIDSVTHFWEEIQKAYKLKKKREMLQFQDWGPLKDQWKEFTGPFVTSAFHGIICGRSAFVYENYQDEEGKRQIEKVGTKMKTEADLGYEPSLLIEMEVVKRGNEGEDTAGSGVKKKIAARLWDHKATVIKDRTRLLNGREFLNPTYADFEPVVKFLNLGGVQASPDLSKSSAELFAGGDRDLAKRIRDVKVTLEEIEGLITKTVPGSTAAEKVAKITFLEDAFGTRSWSAVESMRLEDMIAGYDKLQGLCEKYVLAKAHAGEPEKKK